MAELDLHIGGKEVSDAQNLIRGNYLPFLKPDMYFMMKLLEEQPAQITAFN